jgi:hypothetical protein
MPKAPVTWEAHVGGSLESMGFKTGLGEISKSNLEKKKRPR